ncbi:MAG: diguanylate cyclase (GGDEF)-like protein [Planctomycetota bacterium]|jgi:diguanylate cyclase (GGDEF)-like protein
MRIAEDQSATLEDIADAVSRDPGLTAKLLKLSNSALFSMGSDVHTIQQATMILGMKSVMMLALSFSLVEAIDEDESSSFDFDDFWTRSLTVAVAGRRLAAESGNPDLADEAFLCGMLSHIGGSVLARGMSVDYAELVKKSPGNWPTTAEEEAHFGFSESDVLMALLGSWSLPERTVNAVAYMQRPESLPSGQSTNTRELTAIMTLAHLTSRTLWDENKATPYRTLQRWTAARYGLGKKQLLILLSELGAGVSEMAVLLHIELPGYMNTHNLVAAAREQLLARSLSSEVDLNQAKLAKEDLRLQKEEFERLATTDTLTGLPNRAALDRKLAEEIRRRLGRNLPDGLGVLMIDVDHFKLFNDTHGHAAGDAVLAAMGDVLDEVLRPGDFSARYGGEEFTVIMPLTTEQGMQATAERVRAAVEATRIPWEGETLRITISLGGARLEVAHSDLDGARLLEDADAKLYEAKASGRNCVCT